MAQRATGKWKGRRNGQGEALLSCRRDGSPVAVIVMRACLRSRVFLRRHLPPNGLACHCPVWQKQGKAVWGQETRSRREWSQVQIHACRVLHPAAFPAVRTNTRRNNEQDGPCRSAQAHKRSAHDDGSVTCDIVVVVGFSLLVPLLKWACAHQAGSRFQNRVTAKSLKNR